MTKEEIQRVLTLSLEYYKSEVFGTDKESEKPSYERIDWIYDKMNSSSKIPKDLEEAARIYFEEPDNSWEVREVFIAGAKWQEEKEKEYSPWLVIPKLKEAALEFREQAKDYEIGGQSFSEDMAVAFTRGAEWQKEQMMQKAVEGEIRGDIRSQEEEPYQIWAESDFLPLDEKFEIGDKVRIIIVREDK